MNAMSPQTECSSSVRWSWSWSFLTVPGFRMREAHDRDDVRVMVGPGPCDLSPSGTITLYMSRGDQMRWDRVSTTSPLSIVFRASQLPVSAKPFMNMTQVNGDWVIGSTLRSGAINPQLGPPPAGYSYKYDQHLGTASCDSRIIIQG